MKKFSLLALILCLLVSSAGAANSLDAGQICISVGRLLEQGHYNRRKLDDEMSRQLLQNYLEALDGNHLFFIEKDVAEFKAKHETTLDDDVLLGNPDAAWKIFSVYSKRVSDRIVKVKELLKTKHDFSTDRTIEINRQKSPWPKDEVEADLLWRDRLEGELLQEKLNEHASEPPETVLTRRYEQILRNIREQTDEDILNSFLSALAQTYDPHSEYLSRSELENFSISMRLSLVGIGAVLQSEDGYAKIMDLVTGGPAQSEGSLKVNDRIAAVAQGKNGEFIDVVGMKLDKVVEMIRGKKGTTVRLQVIPTAVDPSQRKIVEIIRDEVKLKAQEAKAEIVERRAPNGKMMRLGYITLPSFYADMENAASKGAKSTTRDVKALLERLQKENIGGLVIDLRRNGGGSLEEAVNLTGLFIRKGPVVQAKDANGNIHISRDRDATVAYEGPLVVLTSRLSASASEIFAAAMQDYGRAIVVGDRNSFGKGTVQTMLEIGRFIPFLGGEGNDAGALKLTIQKFYRIAGGSTQLHGVKSDLSLPSTLDHPELGESALKNPLAYDNVPSVSFERVADEMPYLKEIRLRSSARVAAEPEFRYVMEDLRILQKRLAENSLSLNEKTRRKQMTEDKARKDRRTAERAKRNKPEDKTFLLTLDDLAKPELQLITNDGKDTAAATPAVDPSAEINDDDDKETGAADPVKAETLNILADVLHFSRAPKTAAVRN
jgi:carboxyl-terminal processing protease